MRPWKKNVIKEIEDRLKNIGFHKKHSLLFYDICEDAIGSIGLGASHFGMATEMALNPVIAVRYLPEVKLVAELAEKEYNPYIAATVASNLGYLMPERRFLNWTFNEDSDHSGTINNLVDEVKEHGIPFIKKHSEIGSILRLLDPEELFFPDREYSIPVLYFLEAEFVKAKKFANDRLLKILQSDSHEHEIQNYGMDKHYDSYKKFADNLIGLIGKKESKKGPAKS